VLNRNFVYRPFRPRDARQCLVRKSCRAKRPYEVAQQTDRREYQNQQTGEHRFADTARTNASRNLLVRGTEYPHRWQRNTIVTFVAGERSATRGA